MKCETKSTMSSVVDPNKLGGSTGSSESDNIKFIIENEKEQEKEQKDKVERILSEATPAETNVLSHLGNYTEEPYSLIESYFEGETSGKARTSSD
jgi:hypothetical protein